jgi:GNAT superfamily N-acetyltransferase
MREIDMRQMRRRERLITIAVVVFFLMGLVLVNATLPDLFVMFIAIGGTAGALMVMYEVRLTKRIAQAEFVRDLQSGFANDPSIMRLWRKILLRKRIGARDRADISSYLTFFETLYLLQERGTVEAGLVDDLFRNRFFSAIGHPRILQATLVGNPGSFTNIHRLIAHWHDYLLHHGKPIHPGYYAYVNAMVTAKGYELVELSLHDLQDLLALQSSVLRDLPQSSWLRENSEEMLHTCLSAASAHTATIDHTETVRITHRALGYRRQGVLVAAAILYDGATGDESIRGHFTTDPEQLYASVNLKLVLSDRAHRRAGLGRALVELLEQRAADNGKREICCTIHPDNEPSMKLFTSLGYKRLKKVDTKYGKRVVYARRLSRASVRWFR